jgi:integrase
MMTGLRSNEARSLQCTDIDIMNRTLTNRSEIAKNRREVSLPMNTWLTEQLAERTNNRSPYIFANPAGANTQGLLPLQRLYVPDVIDGAGK